MHYILTFSIAQRVSLNQIFRIAYLIYVNKVNTRVHSINLHDSIFAVSKELKGIGYMI